MCVSVHSPLVLCTSQPSSKTREEDPAPKAGSEARRRAGRPPPSAVGCPAWTRARRRAAENLRVHCVKRGQLVAASSEVLVFLFPQSHLKKKHNGNGRWKSPRWRPRRWGSRPWALQAQRPPRRSRPFKRWPCRLLRLAGRRAGPGARSGPEALTLRRPLEGPGQTRAAPPPPARPSRGRHTRRSLLRRYLSAPLLILSGVAEDTTSRCNKSSGINLPVHTDPGCGVGAVAPRV